MSDLSQYINRKTIENICTEIEMNTEAAEKIAAFSDDDFTPLQEDFYDLFDISTGKEATRAVTEFCGTDNNGLKALALYLAAAENTRQIYAEKGIDKTVFIDTMKIFSRFVNEHYSSYGCYGFDRGWWIYRNLSASLFRLGLLEFEMCVLDEPLGDFPKNTKALSVHIPSDAVITRAALDDSYKYASDFFARHFPEFDYKLTFCHTWLFAPVLNEILPEKSKILMFRNDYRIISVDYDDNDFLGWVFDIHSDNLTDYSALPENTALRRGLKKHLLDGGKVGTAHGILIKN